MKKVSLESFPLCSVSEVRFLYDENLDTFRVRQLESD